MKPTIPPPVAQRGIDTTSLLGKPFGRLTVKAYAGKALDGSGSMWECLCSCGNRKVIRRKQLVRGDTRSCGCLRKDYQPWNRGAYSLEAEKTSTEKRRLAFRLLLALTGELGLEVMEEAFDELKRENAA